MLKGSRVGALLAIGLAVVHYIPSVTSSRVVKGEKAQDGEFPYVVIVEYEIPKESFVNICTGALIHLSWVLTGAHCLFETGATSDYRLTAGVASRNGTELKQVRRSQKAIGHPKYFRVEGILLDTPVTAAVGLIQTDAPFDSSSGVGVLQLFAREWTHDVDCMAFTWGNFEDHDAKQLYKLDVTARHGVCPILPRFFSVDKICLVRSGLKGICMNDWGGPLVCNGEIVGVASTVMFADEDTLMTDFLNTGQCRHNKTQDLYTYVCAHLDWIAEQVPGVPRKPGSCNAQRLVPLVPAYVLTLVFFSRHYGKGFFVNTHF